MASGEPRRCVLDGYLALSNAIRDHYGLHPDVEVGDYSDHSATKARILAARKHVTEARGLLGEANVDLADTTLQAIIESLNELPRAKIKETFGPFQTEGHSFAELYAAWADQRALTRVAKHLRAFVSSQAGWGDVYQQIQAIDQQRLDSIHKDLTALTLRNPLIWVAAASVVSIAMLIWWTF